MEELYRIDLTFIAANQVEKDILIDTDNLFPSYPEQDTNNHWELEYALMDGENQVAHMLTFLFGAQFEADIVQLAANKQLINLTSHKHNCMTFEEFDERYQEWIELTGRENTMDEYGTLQSIIGYVDKHINKPYLFVRVEKGNNPVQIKDLPK